MLSPTIETGVAVERQQQLLDYIRANPSASIVFSGSPGVGKTTLLHELERCARAQHFKNHAVYSKPMPTFQFDATAARARGERVLVESLLLAKQHQLTWSVFLDDFDKITGTEFIQKEVYAVVDAIVQTGAQLALTTNMNWEEFQRFFGDAVAWRVRKYCRWAEVNRVPVSAPGVQAA